MRKKQSETEPKPIKYRPAPIELIISSIVGAVSGLISAAATIRREFKQESAYWPEAVKINQDHKLELDKLDNKFLGNPDQWRQHATEKRDTKARHSKEFIQEFLYKKHGIETEGAIDKAGIWKNIKMAVYGTYQRHEHLGTSNKRLDVWYKAAAVTTIVGVGIYNLLTSIATRKKTRQIEDILLDRVLKIPDVPTPASSEQGTPEHTHAAHHQVSDIKHERRIKETPKEASLHV